MLRYLIIAAHFFRAPALERLRAPAQRREAAMHALIIEDESLIAMTIEEVLRDCGFTSFDIVASQEKAVAAATERCPDLITADVQLRPGSGIAAVETICGGPPIPVIMITGCVADVRERLPAHQVLTKPFSEATLIAAVAS